MKFKAVIFDMDGVLIDSELHWLKAEMDFLRAHNIQLTPGLTKKMMGRSLQESVALVKNEFNLPHPVEELMGAKKMLSDAIYTHEAQQMPGVPELLKEIKSYGIKTAIASGSMLSRIETIVERFGWHQYFDALVSTDHVNYVGKPDPAIYRYTSETLEVSPIDSVVIEDAVNGILAAKAAGMSCIAVPDVRWDKGDFSEADLIVDSLKDERLRRFIGL